MVKTNFPVPACIDVDTFGGKVHVEWDPHAASADGFVLRRQLTFLG